MKNFIYFSFLFGRGGRKCKWILESMVPLYSHVELWNCIENRTDAVSRSGKHQTSKYNWNYKRGIIFMKISLHKDFDHNLSSWTIFLFLFVLIYETLFNFPLIPCSPLHLTAKIAAACTASKKTDAWVERLSIPTAHTASAYFLFCWLPQPAPAAYTQPSCGLFWNRFGPVS